jgi:hypothetical protein
MADNYKVALSFANLPDSDDSDFAANVAQKMTGNPAFPNPPVAVTQLAAQRIAFDTAIAAAMQGGLQLTAAKNAARKVLDNSLRSIAAYVQSIARQDLTLLLSSGFEAASNNRTPSPLATPTILNIDNSATEKFFLRLQTVSNAAAYQIRYSATGTENPVPVTVESTGTRSILVPDLAPGTVYSLQARAIGGATGYSEWSDPISKMAT